MSDDFAAISANKKFHIGNYLILNTIGKGSFAEVRLAWHIIISTEVIVNWQGSFDIL